VVGATNLRLIMMQQKQADFTIISTTEREEAEKMGLKVIADLASKKIPYPHSGLISSQKILKDRRDTMLRFGRATVEAIHFFKNNKAQTVAILKKYAKTDTTTLDSAYAYIKSAVPDLPYPTLEGMKTILNEMGRTRPEVLKHDAASMVDPSLIKAIDDEGFLKKLKQSGVATGGRVCRETQGSVRSPTLDPKQSYFRTNRTSTAAAPCPWARTMIGLISMSDSVLRWAEKISDRPTIAFTSASTSRGPWPRTPSRTL
jgi:hypothetical protein